VNDGDPWDLIRACFDAAIEATDPYESVQRAISLDGDALGVDDERVPLSGRLVVVAIGKAAERMAHGASAALGARIDSGYAITKDGHVSGVLDGRFQAFEARHPVPDERGVEATRIVLSALAALAQEDVVLALISGGGSALLEAPRDPVSLADVAEVTEMLLAAGAPIQDLNAVRVPLSAVKGGGLRLSSPAGRFITLIVSDVLGNDPQVIASGPTVRSELTSGGALRVLDRYDLRKRAPDAVIEILDRESAERVDGSRFERDLVRIVSDNESAIEAATDAAMAAGWKTEVIWQRMEGEAADLAREWVDVLDSFDTPIVLLGGGEATVTVRGDGVGGRNTEFALTAALELERRGMAGWTVASLATDGQDGLTDSAGSIVSAGDMALAREQGLDPEQALARNDSATLLDEVDRLVHTGPTGTNVNDLYFAVRSTKTR
jgi:glycerate 2-kinase